MAKYDQYICWSRNICEVILNGDLLIAYDINPERLYGIDQAKKIMGSCEILKDEEGNTICGDYGIIIVNHGKDYVKPRNYYLPNKYLQ